MNELLFTEAEIRRFVQATRHAVVVARGEEAWFANAPFCELFGYTPQALFGRPFADLVPPQERSRLYQQNQRFMERGAPSRDRFVIGATAADGSVLAIRVELSVLLDAGGGIPFLLVSCLPLEEEGWKFALEEALVRVSSSFVGEITEGRVRQAVCAALAKEGMWAGFFGVSGGALQRLEATGEPPERLGPSHAHDAIDIGRPVFGGEGAVITHAFIPIATEVGTEVLVVFGTFEPGHNSALSLLGKQIAGAYDNARLIANLEHRNHETQLLLEVARTFGGTLELEEILNSATDYLVRLVDASNCFLMMYDERREVLYGAAASRSVRADFTNRLIPLHATDSLAARVARERVTLAAEDVTNTPYPMNQAMVARYRERAVLAVPVMLREQLLAVVILDDTRRPRRFTPEELDLIHATLGQIALSISNARLYASLKESYGVLEEARAEMVKQERLAALGELSAIVAHEVRNPLGVIFNAVSSLRRLVSGGDAPMLVEILAEESDRLNRLVGELLDFARPRELVMQPEDVAKVIQDSIEAAANDPHRGPHPVKFEADVERDLPPVPMDRRLIRQALVNVAVNAAQAMPQGGRLRVSALREKHQGRPVLRIDVRDDGAGMPPEVLGRIFEPFFTTKAKGTGLGLAVVKRILEDHHGEVTVESAVGRGTTFIFRIPIDEGGKVR